MVDSTVDFVLPESGKLDGKNYPIWKFKMKNLLKLKDLWEIVEGKDETPYVMKPITVPDITPQEKRTEDERYVEELEVQAIFDKRAQEALCYINMNVKDSIICQISGATSPNEAWTILQTLFESVNTTRLLFLKQKFHAFKKEPNEQITAYLTRLKDITNQLLSVDEIVTDVDMVSITMNDLTMNESNSPWKQFGDFPNGEGDHSYL